MLNLDKTEWWRSNKQVKQETGKVTDNRKAEVMSEVLYSTK